MGIKERLLKICRRKDVQSSLSLAAEGSSLEYPATGVLVQAFREVAIISDEIKVNRILKGLASGLNQERFTNELINYVNKSDEHATKVVNLLHKALMADSEIICVLMGRILADHISTGNEFDKVDAIIIHALENATDEDLIEFRELFIKMDGDHLPKDDKYVDCIEWGISNRLFTEVQKEYYQEGTLTINEYTAPKATAYRLMEYLDEIKQLFRWDNLEK